MKQIEWNKAEGLERDLNREGTEGIRLLVWFTLLGITIFVAVLLAPVFDAIIVFALYHHCGAALAERANARPGGLAAVVPAAVSTVLLLRTSSRRTITKPWSWL